MKRFIFLTIIFLTLLLFLPYCGYNWSTAKAQTLQEEFTGDDSSRGAIFGVNWKAQTWTTINSYELESVFLKLEKTIGSPSNVTLEVKATDVNNKPTGSALASKTLNGSTFTATPGAWVEFVLTSPIDVDGGTLYALVLSCPSCDASNYIGWRGKVGAPLYADGQFGASSDSGSTWTMDNNNDFDFQTWGSTDEVATSIPPLFFVPVAYAESICTAVYTGNTTTVECTDGSVANPTQDLYNGIVLMLVSIVLVYLFLKSRSKKERG